MRLKSFFVQSAILAAVMLLISSCASLSPNGVGRVKRYTFAEESVPEAYDGCKIAFISDLHYPSLFTHKRLGKLVRRLQKESPDLLLLGGDYVTDVDSVNVLFKSLSAVKPRMGTYAVLGNHDRCNERLIARVMEECCITLLADDIYRMMIDDGKLNIAGVRDSFACDSSFIEYFGRMSNDGLVILLCHTPDYAERSAVAADLVLSGHTHGGQVSLFGLYTPVKNTRYGSRFLRGRNRTSNGVTVITTNGVGTSRRKVRFCVPSEIVLVTLKRQE